MKSKTARIDDAVLNAYIQDPDQPLSNQTLYKTVEHLTGSSSSASQSPAKRRRGSDCINLATRAIRWSQQSLKRAGILEKLPGQRGLWALSHRAKQDLHRARPTITLLAFSTDLGIAIWGSNRDVFTRLDLPITLCVTSPPYPLRRARAYGNPTVTDYVDFICQALEPIIHQLVPGGSICLNLGNDIFEAGSPARTLYRERTLIALCERFGLAVMDTLIWNNPTRPPGPLEWSSKKRVQLNATWEAVLWLTNDPHRVKADNRRVLRPHTPRHHQLLTREVPRPRTYYADGAHQLRPNSFSRMTAGAIPRNLLTIPHDCPETRAYRRHAAELGVPPHGAIMPIALARFLIQFLSQPDDWVVDPFCGRGTIGQACQELHRRFVCTDIVYEYLRAGAESFRQSPQFRLDRIFAGLTQDLRHPDPLTEGPAS